MANDAWLSDLLQQAMLSDAGVAQELAATLATRVPSVDEDGIATRALLTALEGTWERGWQPADVVHVARREAARGSVSLVVALIAEHARRSDAVSRAPESWMEQLSELGALAPGDSAVVSAWHRTGRRAPTEAWRIVLQLAGMLRTAVRIDALVPPPSRWVHLARIATKRLLPAMTARCDGSVASSPRRSPPSSRRRPNR